MKSTDKLLRAVERLTTRKTKRPAYATYRGTFILGIGYDRYEDEIGTTESYLVPFGMVQIFTPKSFE